MSLCVSLTTMLGCWPCPCVPEAPPDPVDDPGATAPVPTTPVAAATATPNPAVWGHTVVLDATGSLSPSGAALSFSWSQTAGVPMLLNDASAARATFVVPRLQSAEELTFVVTVSNGTESSEAAVTVRVRGDNNSPLVNAGSDAQVPPSSRVQLDGRGSFDPDGDEVTFLWEQVLSEGVPFVSITGADTATPTFVSPERAVLLVFRLTVSDGAASASDDVWMMVLGDGSPPPTPVKNPLTADFDADGDMDGVDYGIFSSCYNANNPTRPGCEAADIAGGDGVDDEDYIMFFGCFNGTGNPPNC